MKKYFYVAISISAFGALLFSACAAPLATTEAPAQPTLTPPTQAPITTDQSPQPTIRVGEQGKLILATTTSTQDSGLLDFILPEFERTTNIKVEVIAVGTGQALQIGKDGNADVLLVHARSKEDEFMAAGDGVRREDLMYNDFVIVGPTSDPAGIKGITDAAAAFKKIADTQPPFISRGDDSGTHTKEKSIWSKAGIEPDGEWYLSTGQGMGEVLTMSDETRAYTLSDRATYLARAREGLGLIILIEGDPILLNPYGIIAVNPAKNPAIQVEVANQFIDWMISVPTQEMIASFGQDEFGQSLFIPASKLWKEAQGGD